MPWQAGAPHNAIEGTARLLIIDAALVILEGVDQFNDDIDNDINLCVY